MNFLKIFLLSFSVLLNAQNGFHFTDHKKTIIHFQYINNLIFIPVDVNGVELTFLLDSGVNRTILFNLDNKEISLFDVEKTSFAGLGEGEPVDGYKSEKNMIRIGENFVDNEHTIYAILTTQIDISKYVGIPVNGIIGYDFFENYPVEINFHSKKIKVLRGLDYSAKNIQKFKSFPISIEKNKPYLYGKVGLEKEPVHTKLLVDLGNSDALWIFPSVAKHFLENHQSIDDYLGVGFNGEVYGKRSRILGFELGDFNFDQPVIAIPNQESLSSLQIVKDRGGSVGNEILRRFQIIFDYPGKQILLKKNGNFQDPFFVDKSGLVFQHDEVKWELQTIPLRGFKVSSDADFPVGSEPLDLQYKYTLIPQYTVSACKINSPCSEAGIKEGDQLVSINNRKAGNLSMNQLTRIFRNGKDGDKIKIEIKRAGINQKLELILKNPLPEKIPENENQP